jgi:hypothetical protein
VSSGDGRSRERKDNRPMTPEGCERVEGEDVCTSKRGRKCRASIASIACLACCRRGYAQPFYCARRLSTGGDSKREGGQVVAKRKEPKTK